MRIHGKWCFAKISFELAIKEHYSLMVLDLDQEVVSSLWLTQRSIWCTLYSRELKFALIIIT